MGKCKGQTEDSDKGQKAGGVHPILRAVIDMETSLNTRVFNGICISKSICPGHFAESVYLWY